MFALYVLLQSYFEHTYVNEFEVSYEQGIVGLFVCGVSVYDSTSPISVF